MTQSARVWTINIRIKRQDGPGQPQRWEEFAVPQRPGLSVTSCLDWIAAHPALSDGKPTAPPAWEADCLDETCGGCSMLINGRALPACSTLVETIGEADSPITLEPLSKFPVVRDLVVDRARLFKDLTRIKAYIPIDGTHYVGQGPAMSRTAQETRQSLSRCISCACCLEACPEYSAGNKFVGAAIINQARVFNEHLIGSELKAERIETLMEEGGIQDCAKSGNCVEACPKDIPLLESIAVISRQTTLHVIRKFFGG